MPSKDTVFPTGKLPMPFLQHLLSRYIGHDDRLIAGPAIGEDVAAVDMGDRYIVIKTDPITFASDQIGWYAVHVNANDVATSGATPLWMLNTIILPQGKTTPALVESIFEQLKEACDNLGITLVGGHTEVAWGIPRPIVVGVLIGEVARERLLTTAGARVGDCLLLAKGIPIEATAIIAREKADELIERGYEGAFLQRAQNYLYDPGISVVDAARIAANNPGVHAMHDPTEGGLATGVHEVAAAAKIGVRLYAERIPLLPEGLRLCQEYGLDPLGVISSGALLIAVDERHAQTLIESYREAGIPCAHIADCVPPGEGILLVKGGREKPLPRYDADQITRVF